MMKRLVVFVILIIFSDYLLLSSSYCATVLLKNGQKYHGDILEENDDYIKLQTVFGISKINKDEIITVDKEENDDNISPAVSNADLYMISKSANATVTDQYGFSGFIDLSDSLYKAKSLSKDDEIYKVKYSGKYLTILDYYKNQVLFLKQQNKILNDEITRLNIELKTITSKKEKNEKDFESKIKTLELELNNKSDKFNSYKFPELNTIEQGKEIEVNNEYIKKVMFTPVKTADVCFVSVKYTIYAEYNSLKPDFEVYFFNENGLNIGKDIVQYKYNSIERGQQELIEKGVPMLITGSAPVYFYVKIIKDQTEDE